MNKTPEQLAKEWAIDWHKDCDYPDPILEIRQEATKHIFLAGYKAAQEHAHAALEEAEAKMQELQDQLADVSKMMPDTCEHILDMGKMVDVNGWISVKDRLPELRQEVLVWYDNGYEVAYLQKFEPPKLQYPQFNNVEMFEWCFGDFEDFDVTHWMPLPEPPKEEE
jgi:hypothetical protein